MYKKFCKASKAGILAYEEVRKPQKAFVLGTTSRGMFLRTVSNRIIFLSMETYCGPLTVLLEGDNDCLGEITSGNWVNIQQDGIIFPGTRKMIHLENIKIWEMDNPEDTITFDSYLIKARLINISKGVYVSKGTQGFSTFLPYLLDFQGEPLTREDQNVFELILKVKSLLKANNGDGIVETLSQLIGLGRGLTPSGDDFSMGLFAALSRWGKFLDTGQIIKQISGKIKHIAAQKTTLISSNLIEAALIGHGDERLIYSLDGIMTGVPDVENCINYLSILGNSSGADALAGIVVAISVCA